MDRVHGWGGPWTGSMGGVVHGSGPWVGWSMDRVHGRGGPWTGSMFCIRPPT